GFIAEEYFDGFAGAESGPDLLRLVAALMAGAQCTLEARAGRTSGRLDGAPLPPSRWEVQLAERRFAVALAEGGCHGDGDWLARSWDWQPGMTLSTATGPGGPLAVQLLRDGQHWVLTTRGAAHRGLVLPAGVAQLARHMIRREPPDLSRLLLSPMPGLLTALHVAEGDTVFPGQPLATVEAMKMENILRATRQAVVKTIETSVGASVA